ncbi:MAG: ABC transporter ATP-binding protein [Oscillospiraceae bacterium]|jgi:ABC-type cobalamin/Fe3+-siderophores transport system ATPase subunit
MLECYDVSVSYNKKRVLGSVSFRAEPGQITVLLGKNGCGKTTLFRALSGNLRYSGSIVADGCQISGLPAHKRARLVSVMPQVLRSPDITVCDLVAFGRQPYTGISGVLSAKDRKIVQDAIEKTGLSALAHTKISRISGGERQKAFFAMLLAQDTPNLLLDEPGAHLDAKYMNSMFRFLNEEKNKGKTVVAVLHDINGAVEIADQIVVIHNGRTMFCGTPADFCLSCVAEEVFGLRKFTCEHADGTSILFFR